jgi:hypothetical protein
MKTGDRTGGSGLRVSSHRSVMQPDTSRAVGGANAPTIGHGGVQRWCPGPIGHGARSGGVQARSDTGARSVGVQARRAGIAVAVDDLIHPKSPSGAAWGTTRRASTIGDDAAPLGLGLRGRAAWATDRPALRALADRRAARSRASTLEHTDQPDRTRGAQRWCPGPIGHEASRPVGPASL